MGEDSISPFFQFGSLFEGSQRFPSLFIDLKVPGSERFYTQVPLPPFGEETVDGNNQFFHRSVEGQTILGRIIEPGFGQVHEIAVVGKPGVLGDLIAELNLLIVDGIEFVFIREVFLGGSLPGFLPDGPVGHFEVFAHLRHGPFFAIEFHRQGTAQLLVMLTKFIVLRVKRDVLLAKELDVIFEVTVVDKVPFGVEFLPRG